MAYKKSKVIIKTYVIGKKIIILFSLLLLLLILFITAFVITKQNYDSKKSEFHMNNIKSAIPVVGVGYKNKNILNMFSLEKSIGNFGVLPCFYTSGTTDKTDKKIVYEQPVQAVAAKVSKVKVSETNNSYNKIEIKNETKYNVDVNSILNMDINFDIHKNKPSILIVHTHGTESYTSDDSLYSSARTTDKDLNMIRVGRQLKTELEKYGFNVIHDTNLNDHPSYNSSYSKTLTVIQGYLKKYPSIKCVFDVHRDAIEAEDGTRMKFTAQIGDKKVSQVMIVSGTDGLGLENPNWQQNLSFALKIHCKLKQLDTL